MHADDSKVHFYFTLAKALPQTARDRAKFVLEENLANVNARCTVFKEHLETLTDTAAE
jgi:hypothetical protein